MQAPAAAPTSSTSRSFAGLLADFATPDNKFPPARDLDGLADDIATLSYEHALRAHARYHPVEPPTASPAMHPPAPSALQAVSEPAPQPPHDPRKCASVTVRLTSEENDRLRHRAAEAGMTLSAYLRSCAFEVEALRAEVKQTLSELRQPAPPPAPTPLWTRFAPWRRIRNQSR